MTGSAAVTPTEMRPAHPQGVRRRFMYVAACLSTRPEERGPSIDRDARLCYDLKEASFVRGDKGGRILELKPGSRRPNQERRHGLP